MKTRSLRHSSFSNHRLKGPDARARHPHPHGAWLALGVLLAGLGDAFGQPVIMRQPQSCTNVAGSTATFTVLATGTPPLAYQWQRDSAMGAQDFSVMPDGTNATLAVTNLQTSDSADYLVVISNSDGAVTSQMARLVVATLPRITSQPSSYSVSVGANITNKVGAMATPAPSYQWCLNGAALAGRTESTLVLTNVQPTNAGAYTVLVTNLTGAVTSRVVTLTVDSTFTKITTGALVSAGGSWGFQWGDVDNDGYLDLAVFYPGEPPAFYHNNHDGTFTKTASPSAPVFNQGASAINVDQVVAAGFADLNNDGYLDFLVGQFVSQALVLLENNGAGAFTNATALSKMMLKDDVWPCGIAWADYNNDGWLDVFVGNTMGGGSALFQNNGQGGFTNIARLAGVFNSGGVNGAAWADYDNDGYPDLFATAIPGNFGLGYVSGVNVLYHNDGNGNFTPMTHSPVVQAYSVGCAWGDYDNSGFPSLFVANGEPPCDYSYTNLLYHNEGNGTFTQVTQGPMVTTRLCTIGCAWGDYDNDGFLDLLVINWPSSGSATNALYHNNGNGTFTAASLGSLTSDLGCYVCCGWADYDNDGFLDLFVANTSGHSVLYRNNGNSNGWLKVQCVGTASNRAGIGAKVRVKAFYRGASRWQLREIFGGDGTFNSQPLLAHFGLGEAANIDTVRIEWPSGIVQELYNLAPKQSLTITEPALTVPWCRRAVLPGTSVTLSVTGQVTHALGSQWQHNGADIPRQTNQMLVLASAVLTDAGQYRMAIQTSDGLVLSPAANLVVLSRQPELLALPWTNGVFALQVAGGLTPGLVVQASTNLIDWVAVLTNKTANAPLIFLDSATGRFPGRFYRTRTP